MMGNGYNMWLIAKCLIDNGCVQLHTDRTREFEKWRKEDPK